MLLMVFIMHNELLPKASTYKWYMILDTCCLWFIKYDRCAIHVCYISVVFFSAASSFHLNSSHESTISFAKSAFFRTTVRSIFVLHHNNNNNIINNNINSSIVWNSIWPKNQEMKINEEREREENMKIDWKSHQITLKCDVKKSGKCHSDRTLCLVFRQICEMKITALLSVA